MRGLRPQAEAKDMELAFTPGSPKMRSIYGEEEEQRNERASAAGRSEGYGACSDDRVGPAR